MPTSSATRSHRLTRRAGAGPEPPRRATRTAAAGGRLQQHRSGLGLRDLARSVDRHDERRPGDVLVRRRQRRHPARSRLAISLPTPTNRGRSYTFQLRRGIRYSTGRAVRPATSASRSSASSGRARREPWTDYCVLNVLDPPFDDVCARRAFNYAIDRRAFARLYGGREQATPTCQILPPQIGGYRWYRPYTASPRAAAPGVLRISRRRGGS